ncbi:MAG: lysophospholipase [Desulfobacteraceae bacterium]|nr:lysophospholipase [Desulfobacteraceae bacterium]MBU4054906.1 lysophospholipase [Pseudomonadota bacterium]
MYDNMFRFDSEVDALSIQTYVWQAENPKAMMVIAHGAAEHALRYERFARSLNASGIEVWAMDHRGHGQSPGPEGLGDFGKGGWDALVADIGQLIKIARQSSPNLPVVLFGHSMGSFAAQQFVADHSHEMEALILSGSTSRKPLKEGEAPAALGDLNQGFEGRTGYDWLSRDPDEVDKYIADPLCGFESFEPVHVAKMMTALRRYQDGDTYKNVRKDLPCLLVAGDNDPVNNHLKGLLYLEELWNEAGIRPVDKQYYPGGRHEMLNEINRDEVRQKIINWINEVLHL